MIPKMVSWSRLYEIGGGNVNKAISVISLLNKIDMKNNNANIIKCLNPFTNTNEILIMCTRKML